MSSFAKPQDDTNKNQPYRVLGEQKEIIMKRPLSKIAAVLAFIIGAMAVFAGGQVLLGRDPGYYVTLRMG